MEKSMEIKAHCSATLITFKDFKIFFLASSKKTWVHMRTYGCALLHTSPGKAACQNWLASCESFRSR